MASQVRMANVSVDVELLPDTDSVYRRFEAHGLDSLSPEEIGLLMMKERLIHADLAEAEQARPEPPVDPEPPSTRDESDEVTRSDANEDE